MLADATVLQLDLTQTVAIVLSIMGGVPTSAYAMARAFTVGFTAYLAKKDELDRKAMESRDERITEMAESVKASAASSRENADRNSQALKSLEESRRNEQKAVVDSLIGLNKEAISAMVTLTTKVNGVDQKVGEIGAALGKFAEVVNRLSSTVDHLAERVETIDQRRNPGRRPPAGESPP